jgi:hypothetical protein
MRLREEREFEREKEKAAAARQSMYDALALADRGALPTAQSQALGQRAVGEIAKSVSGAMGAFQSGAQTPFDAGAIAQGAGRIGEPAAKFTVGGVEYALPDQEQRRKALKAQEFATELTQRQKLTRAEQDEKNQLLDVEARRIQAAYKASSGQEPSLDVARQIASGRKAAEFGVYTPEERKRMSLEEKSTLANIEQSTAAAAASRAAADLARAGGKKRTPEELRDNLITAAAKYATTMDQETGAMPSMEQVNKFYSTLSGLAGIPLDLEQEFNSPAEIAKINQLRKQQFSDEEIRAALRRAKAASQTPR